MGVKEAKRAAELPFETTVYCGTGKDAYRVVIEFPMAGVDLREVIQKRVHPDLKGKEGEALVDTIVKGALENNTPVMVSRFKNNMKNDGPQGKPAYTMYQPPNKMSLEEHFRNGKLNDSASGEAAFQVYNDAGRLERAAHYRDGEVTMIKHFNYSDAVFREEDNSLRARLKRIFNHAAAPSAKEWKTCYVTVEYRNADHLTIDGPCHTPGLQTWEMGYSEPAGNPARMSFSKQARLTHATHYNNGHLGKEANALEKFFIRKQWPALK